MKRLETILEKMPTLPTPQKNFPYFINDVGDFRGRVNYTNMSRYSELTEKTVTSHYPQVAAARIKSGNGGMVFPPSSLSLR